METFPWQKVYRPFCAMKLGLIRAQFNALLTEHRQLQISFNESYALKRRRVFSGLTEGNLAQLTFLWVVRDDSNKAQNEKNESTNIFLFHRAARIKFVSKTETSVC